MKTEKRYIIVNSAGMVWMGYDWSSDPSQASVYGVGLVAGRKAKKVGGILVTLR